MKVRKLTFLRPYRHYRAPRTLKNVVIAERNHPLVHSSLTLPDVVMETRNIGFAVHD
jgi:hypothetical protein